MSRESQGAPLWRCLVVWLVATAASATVVSVLRHDLVRAGAPTAASFETLLVSASAMALAGCAAWFWLVSTTLVVGAALGSSREIPGCPAAVRRAVLIACGAALLVTASPASADPAGRPPTPDPSQVLTGLPLPDRSVAGPVRMQVVVRAGDSLWAIAERSLPPGAGPAAIDARWRAIWAVNRLVVGADPDLIHPGAVLRLPREESS